MLTEEPTSKDVLHLSWSPSGQAEEGFTGKVINPGEVREEGAIVFPVLHGPNGEDGAIQSFLGALSVLYVGAGVLTNACAMDKTMTKCILQAADMPQVPYVLIFKNQRKENPKKVFDQCEGFLLCPMFIEPTSMDSSIGITKTENRGELQDALATVYQYDSRAIVEQGTGAREIEVVVLGNENVRVTLPSEVVKDVAFYDHEVKYISNKIEVQASAEVSGKVYQETQEYAKLTYTTLGGNGLSQYDFFLTNKNELFLSKSSSVPGLTEFSMHLLLWENMGSKHDDLIEELIQLGMNRYHQRQPFFEEGE